jgi:hypothetical protein
MQRVEVLVPIGQPRSHDYLSVRVGSACGGDHVSIVAIGEPAVAKNQGDILRVQSFLTLADSGGTNSFMAFLVKDFV